MGGCTSFKAAASRRRHGNCVLGNTAGRFRDQGAGDVGGSLGVRWHTLVGETEQRRRWRRGASLPSLFASWTRQERIRTGDLLLVLLFDKLFDSLKLTLDIA